MSQIEKILIPLIDDNIKQSDVNNNDFVGVFTEDVNAPTLDYVYIVFMYNINSLRKNLGVNGIDCVRKIGDSLYHIFKFPRLPDVKKVLSGNYSTLSNKGISNIYNFWNGVDDLTANYPCYRVIAKEAYHRIIPEETYVPLCKKRGQGVTVQKQ